jgi:hypothetical protein
MASEATLSRPQCFAPCWHAQITHFCLKVWVQYKIEFEEPRRTFLGIQLLHELPPDCHSKFSLCVIVSLERHFKIVNSTLHHYDHSVLCLLLVFSNDYNKPTKFQPNSCDWIREYQFLSVQHKPNTSFPQVTSHLVNTGVPDEHHHTRDTTQFNTLNYQ